MRIEARRHKDHLRSVRFDRWPPARIDGAPKAAAIGAFAQWRIDDVRAIEIEVPVGLERVLETRTDQDFRLRLEQIDGAISMMDVEVEDRHALDLGIGERCTCRKRNVVVDAETHCGAFLGMVTGWADGTESVVCVAAQHRFGGGHAGARSSCSRRQAVRSERSVGIDANQARGRGNAREHAEVLGAMRRLQCSRRNARCNADLELRELATGLQCIVYCAQARRRLRVAVLHLMFEAVRMAIEERSLAHATRCSCRQEQTL